MRWRPCSVTNNKPGDVCLAAGAKINLLGLLLGQRSLGHRDGCFKFRMHKWKVFAAFIHLCIQHTPLLACMYWESYPVLNNRLSANKLLPVCLFTERGSVPHLRGGLMEVSVPFSEGKFFPLPLQNIWVISPSLPGVGGFSFHTSNWPSSHIATVKLTQ